MTQQAANKAPAHLRSYVLAAAAGFMLVSVSSPVSGEPNGAIIMVEADHAIIHRLPRAASTIIVGNPTIADVNVQGGKLLVITGKNYGTTNLIALDAEGKQIGAYKINVKTNGVYKLTLYKGASRFSYTCAPRCERELLVGDGVGEFKNIHKQVGDKASIVKTVGSDSSR